MTAKEILNLRQYDFVKYNGKVGQVVNWKCHKDPLFASDGTRIDAEPLFKWSDGLIHSIHPRFWNEVNAVQK